MFRDQFRMAVAGVGLVDLEEEVNGGDVWSADNEVGG